MQKEKPIGMAHIIYKFMISLSSRSETYVNIHKQYAHLWAPTELRYVNQ